MNAISPASPEHADPKDELVNVKLIIEYDGSGYSGWQRQKISLPFRKRSNRPLQFYSDWKVLSSTVQAEQMQAFMLTDRLQI